jgi:hypothetical protein
MMVITPKHVGAVVMQILINLFFFKWASVYKKKLWCKTLILLYSYLEKKKCSIVTLRPTKNILPYCCIELNKQYLAVLLLSNQK